MSLHVHTGVTTVVPILPFAFHVERKRSKDMTLLFPHGLREEKISSLLCDIISTIYAEAYIYTCRQTYFV